VSKRRRTPYIQILSLFLVALVPRVINLGAFVTPDERRWLSRSADLFRAISTGDLSLAYHSGNPAGIVTKWLGMAGIAIRYLAHKLGWPAHLDPNLAASQDIGSFMEAIQEQPQNILDVLPVARLPVAVLTAVMVVLIYVLLRQLWGERIALIGGFLIALDPFLLAHSRVLHQDALVAGFIILSVLCLTVSLQEDVSWPLLVGSGALAGLAALTKPTGFFLTIWTGGWIILWVIRRSLPSRKLGRAIALMSVWLAALGIVYFALWPAMWSEPAPTFANMLTRSTELAAGGHDQFFFGKTTSDPGSRFYTVVLLLRNSPVVWVGLAALAWFAIRGQATSTRGGRVWPAVFIVLFMTFVTFSAKKSDRYLLPVFPMLDILAAMGLVELLDRLRAWDRRRTLAGSPPKISALVAGLVLIVIVQAGLILWHAPYYLTYYNPLVGGPWTAPHVLLVGWGEGLDRAGRYLDEKENADSLAVASFYRREFSPYFRGEIRKVADSTPDDFDLIAWHATDYVVNYVSQMQRDQPTEATVRYLRSLEPEHVVKLGGIDYAWIYRTPEYIPDELIPAEHITRQAFGPSILLLGSDTPSFENSNQPFVRIVLYWQALAPLNTDYQVDLRVIDGAGNEWGEERNHPYSNQYRTSLWPRGLVLRDSHEIQLPTDVPPGEYHIALRLVDVETGDGLIPPEGEVLIGPLYIGAR
jgi:hypothetical protein